MSVFTRRRQIRFSDCDPGGIVFYPRYFQMFNDVVEDLLGEATGAGFADQLMRRRIGSPLVHSEADFKAVSLFGEEITVEARVIRLGSTSLTLGLRVLGPRGEERITATEVRVMTDLATHASIEVPPDVRRGLEPFVVQHHDDLRR